MSFLDKVKKEFEGLALGSAPGAMQGGQGQGSVDHHNAQQQYPPQYQEYQQQYQQQYQHPPQQHLQYPPPYGQYPGQASPSSPPPGSYGQPGPPAPRLPYPQDQQGGPPPSNYQPFKPLEHQHSVSPRPDGYAPYSPSPSAVGSPHASPSHYQQSQTYLPPSHYSPSGQAGLAPGAAAMAPYESQSAPSLPTTAGALEKGSPLPTPGGPCPTPPRWVPCWSEAHKHWYFVETTGRAEWHTPGGLPPAPDMPAFIDGDTKAKSNWTSRETLLAAGGGFVAGGIAGAMIHKVYEEHKKTKLDGRTADDFKELGEYTATPMGCECDICRKDIAGPYAHCPKCNGGNFDICRRCLLQGFLCKGEGQHRLAKVFPQVSCNACDREITGDFYHCAKCDSGDWDVCEVCFARGNTCKAPGKHQLAKLYIPGLEVRQAAESRREERRERRERKRERRRQRKGGRRDRRRSRSKSSSSSSGSDSD